MIIIKCDTCGTKKQVKYCDKKYLNKPFHYCCRKCFHISASKGLSSELCRKKLKEKTGKEYPMQIDNVKAASKASVLKKYGVTNISKATEIKNKKIETLFKNYGVKNMHDSKDIMDKIRQTNIEKYGVDCAMKNPEVIKKFKQTIINKYGVDNVSKLQIIKDKKEKLFIKKYGVKNPLMSSEIKSKIDYVANFKKAHATNKKNGTYKLSKAENALYDLLCDFYGEKNIIRQVLINNWNIDFYIKNINTYIQLDGVYWHGLNRDIETIKKSSNDRDKNIIKIYYKDIMQNNWFKKNNIKFKRITDVQFKKLTYNDIINIIERE